MRKKAVRRIWQTMIAGIVGGACIFGCGNLEAVLADNATVTDATVGDATAGEADSDTDIQSSETIFDGAVSAQADATESDAAQMHVNMEKGGISVLNAVAQAALVSNKKYAGQYHIDYILSHYGYFVQNDLEGDYVSDTVGAIVVGNCLNLKNTIGKVKSAASYAKYLIDLADYHAGSWNDTTGIDTNFYYTESYMSYKDWLTNRMVKVADDYINMDEAFDTIMQESKVLEKAGQAGYMEQGDLVIDFADSRTITVSGADFTNAKRVILKNVTAEDIFSNAYTISVSGDSDYILDTSKIEICGTPLNNNYFFNLVNNRPGGLQGGQYYSGGFGLVWNFPDAKNITANFLTGHIVAPSGNVSLIGGNHEGQVIARNVKASSESHFYPYNVTTTESGTTTEVVTTTESGTTEAVTTTESSTTTESGTTEVVTTTESGTTTENVSTSQSSTSAEYQTTAEQLTTRETLVVMPKADIKPVKSNEVKTGDIMALGIVITLLVAAGAGILLITVLWEHKKK